MYSHALVRSAADAVIGIAGGSFFDDCKFLRMIFVRIVGAKHHNIILSETSLKALTHPGSIQRAPHATRSTTIFVSGVQRLLTIPSNTVHAS